MKNISLENLAIIADRDELIKSFRAKMESIERDVDFDNLRKSHEYSKRFYELSEIIHNKQIV